MANGFEKIINESFSKYFENKNIEVPKRKINESWVTDTWEKQENPLGFAKSYHFSVKILGHPSYDETTYKFTGRKEDIERAINDGCFYSANECSDDVADLLIAKNNLKGEALNEAVPRDLMRKIKNTRRYKAGRRYNSDTLDYASADMQEITADDVMRMKKAGEDLSDIYVLNDDGDLIELNRDGHPIESGSTYFERANQSLSKTLSNAVKIYKGNIDYFSQTQPDKFAERTSDEWRREANRKLGNVRPDSWDRNSIEEFRQRLEGPTKQIAAIKKEYEDGDISRKEMEARIEKVKKVYKDDDLSYYADRYNSLKQDRADARYYDSNNASRKNMDAYEEAKNNLEYAQWKLEDNEKRLAKAQAGEGRGNQRISELKRKIADLKRNLAYYEKELAEDPEQKELKELQTGIDNATQEINDNQAVINKLLRRNKNESLKRKPGKRLNESKSSYDKAYNELYSFMKKWANKYSQELDEESLYEIYESMMDEEF